MRNSAAALQVTLFAAILQWKMSVAIKRVLGFCCNYAGIVFCYNYAGGNFYCNYVGDCFCSKYVGITKFLVAIMQAGVSVAGVIMQLGRCYFLLQLHRCR